METKSCSICKKDKPLSDYTKAGKGKYRPCCKICYKERYGEKEKLAAQRSYQNNKEERDDRNKQWRKNNKEQSKKIYKKSYEKNKDSILEKQKEIRKNNPAYYANYARNRENRDIHFKVARRLRNRIYSLMKGNKSRHTLELLGCSLEELKLHLESQFTEGMTWDNYGEWHIDHKKPCAAFDLALEEEQRKCFHYTNLQPLWKLDNLRKGDKYESS